MAVGERFADCRSDVCRQEPEAAAVRGSLGPVHREHGRVLGGIGADGGLRAERVRFTGTGRGRLAGAAQLRAGVPHARGVRPTGPDGLRRAGVAGVRPEPGASVRVAHRRGLHRPRARPAARVGPVRGLLLRHRGAPPVRHGRTGEHLLLIDDRVQTVTGIRTYACAFVDRPARHFRRDVCNGETFMPETIRKANRI